MITRMDADHERQLDGIVRFNGMAIEELKGRIYYSYAFPIRSPWMLKMLIYGPVHNICRQHIFP